MSTETYRRITAIRVKGLFGYYDHTVNLNTEERVTIVHGPNGVGKTKLLQMVSWLLKNDINQFARVPFDSFVLSFSDDAKLSITTIRAKESCEVELTDPRSGRHENKVLHLISRDRDGRSPWIADSWLAPAWLLEYCSQVHCLFIETQRLLRFDYAEHGQQELYIRVEDAAHALARLVSENMARYGRESQTLDQSYPQRVLAKTKNPVLNVEELKLRLQRLTQSQRSLQDLGLLDQANSAPPDLSDLSELNPTELRAMTLYVTDTEKKLSVLEDFAKRIRLLLQVSPKFLRKRIRLDREIGLTVENDRGQPLALNMLSSGEQHELVLHFDLLFRVQPNTLVLIDEPELSLHVTWQKQFLPNLLEIAKTVAIDVVVATHSPFIIGDRADLMVALEDEAS